MPGPTDVKLLAEAKYFEAQTAKLQEELTELRKPKRFWSFAVESTKVFGAVVLGLGGVLTAFTGYQLSEAKKEHIEAQIEKREIDLQKLEQVYAATQKDQENRLATARAQLASIQTDLEALKIQITASTSAAKPELAPVITKTEAAQKAVKDLERESGRATQDMNRLIRKLGIKF
jgi:DNA repair exonuclease SbcCD ATPase subunit